MSNPLELRLLRAFVVVAEEEHVSRAAEILHVSQSPLSRQIRTLEARLGVALFEREKQRLFLTTAGRRFLGEARDLLARAELAEARARSWSMDGTLEIGYVEGAMLGGLLDEALARFHRRYPQARLNLHAMRSAAQHQALLERRLDLAVVHTPPPDLAAFRVLSLRADPLVIALPAAHPLASRARIEAEDLRGISWIAVPAQTHPGTRARFLEVFARFGIVPEIRFEAPELITRLRMVGAGLGCAFVQASVRDCISMSDVVFRDANWVSVEVPFLALCRAAQSDPLLDQLLAILEEIVASPAS